MCLVIMDRDWAAGRYCAGGLRGRRFVRRAMGRGLAEERRRARAEGSVADGVCQCSFLHTSCTRGCGPWADVLGVCRHDHRTGCWPSDPRAVRRRGAAALGGLELQTPLFRPAPLGSRALAWTRPVCGHSCPRRAAAGKHVI